MEDKVAEIEHLMAPIMDGMQMRHLHAVLVSCLCVEETPERLQARPMGDFIDEFLG